MAAPPTRSYEDRDVSVQGQGKLLNVSSVKNHISPFLFLTKSHKCNTEYTTVVFSFSSLVIWVFGKVLALSFLILTNGY